MSPAMAEENGFSSQRSGHVTVVGEALVDLIIDGSSTEAHVGGGPFNTARALARLGVSTSFLGRVSSDVFGRRIQAALVADGVHAEAVIATEDPTTLALAELSNGSASYRFYLDGTSVPGCDQQMAASAVSKAIVAHGPIEVLHVGTLAMVLEPFASATESLVMAASPSTLVFADPNIRAAVIRDPEAVRARIERILGRANVVKVSDDDLRWMDPSSGESDAALRAAAARILGLGPSVVFLTRGGDGVTVLTADGSVDIPAAVVKVVDTVGAGDTFSAGVLAWWLANERPSLGSLAVAEAAARHGVRAAGVTVSRAGANPPWAHEL